MCSHIQSRWKVLVVSALATASLFGQTDGQQPSAPEVASPLAPASIISGTVTLPYGELKGLWDAAQAKENPLVPTKVPEPPVTYSIQSARYELSLNVNSH